MPTIWNWVWNLETQKQKKKQFKIEISQRWTRPTIRPTIERVLTNLSSGSCRLVEKKRRKEEEEIESNVKYQTARSNLEVIGELSRIERRNGLRWTISQSTERPKQLQTNVSTLLSSHFWRGHQDHQFHVIIIIIMMIIIIIMILIIIITLATARNRNN